MLSGEWFDERDALTMPLPALVTRSPLFMMEHPNTARMALTPALFTTVPSTYRAALRLCHFLPVLIRMIRQAQIYNIELPVEVVDGFVGHFTEGCKYEL